MKLIEGLSNEEYHSKAALSSSQLKMVLKDPRLFKRAYLDKSVDVSLTSEAVKIGSLFHTMVLEPHLPQPIVYPEAKMDRRTSRYKEWLKEHEDEDQELLISGEQNDKLQQMYASLEEYDLPSHGINLSNNINEASIFFIHDDVSLRIRPDSFNKDEAHIVDLKTTSRAVDEHTFYYLCHDLAYDLSAGMYCLGMEKYLGRKVRFSWVVVQNKEPYSTVVYHAGLEMLTQGTKKFREALSKYKLYKETSRFEMQDGPTILDRGSHSRASEKEIYYSAKKVYNNKKPDKLEIL